MKRNEFIKSLGALMATSMIDLKSFGNNVLENANTQIMPALFIGHGNPMNALYDNPFTKAISKTANELPIPKAILVVSAHWQTNGTFVTSMIAPKTIHDFGGFPKALFDVEYDAPGAPEFAKKVIEQVKHTHVKDDHDWGLDHGAWTILKHMYPKADIPVFQLSLDYSKSAQWHYDLAKELNALRSKGLLIVGSGNIVHNLGRVSWDDPTTKFDWSIEFDERVKSDLLKQNHVDLINYEKIGKSALLSVPTNEHYLPMLYAAALQQKNEPLNFFYESIEMGSISMRCFKIG
jgi:4,5-DOPA dioxygenase extradiol